MSIARDKSVADFREQIDKHGEVPFWKVLIQFHSGHSFYELESMTLNIARLLHDGQSLRLLLRRSESSTSGFFNYKKSLIPYRNLITRPARIKEIFDTYKQNSVAQHVKAFESPRLANLSNKINNSAFALPRPPTKLNLKCREFI